MITISTAWNATRHTSGEMIIRELQHLGFASFELSVKLTEAKLLEIESILLQIEVASLHNFCPVPHGSGENGGGDFYYLSSPDPAERKRAIDASAKTIDWAKRLGARAVVFHFGRVEMPDQFGRIWPLRLAGQHAEADRLLAEDLALREERKAPFLEAALESARDLVEIAAGEVLIGVETRYHYTEIPSIDEIQDFMGVVGPGQGGYWHDFGHAEINDFVRAARHEDYFRRYGPRTVGMHIHDVDDNHQDHGSLTCGTIDFEKLLPMVPKDALAVLEIHHATGEQLVESRRIWQSLLAHNSQLI